MQKISIEQHSAAGLVWLVGWLFTLGFLRLAFWAGVAAIFIWPYDLGVFFSSIHSGAVPPH
jgi:hypothetical protein